MSRIIVVLLIVCLMLAVDASTGQSNAFVQVHARDFGYRVGDLVYIEAEVAMPTSYLNYNLVGSTSNLPEWLELVREDARWDRRGFYEIRWIYQLFYVPDNVINIEIPTRRLKFSAKGYQDVWIDIPSVSLSIAAISKYDDALAGKWVSPAPSPRLVYAFGSVAFVALIVEIIDRFKRRRQGMFHKLEHRLRFVTDGAYAIRLVHRALNEKIGRVALSPKDVIQNWPEADKARIILNQFFDMSTRQFYDVRNQQDAIIEDRLVVARKVAKALRRLE